MAEVADEGRGLAAKLSGLPLLRNPRVRKALLWLGALLLLVLAVWLILIAWSMMGRSARQILVLLLALAVVLLWFVKGMPRLERRQALRRMRGDLAPGDAKDEEEPRRNMLQALLQTKQILAHSPDVDRKRDPLYAIPWILFLGDSKSLGQELLKAASSISPFPAPPRSENTNQFWHWWLFKGAIAIEADPRFVCDPSDRLHRGIWYHALQQLNSERKNMPINGVAVLVSAEKLLRDQEELRHYGLNLRRLVDECLEHLQVVVPVYLIVTGCERLPGFESFVRLLPADALRQGVGHRIGDPSRINASSWQEFPAIFSGLCDRMHGIRLSGIRMEPDAIRRKGVWDFVEAFNSLSPGLALVIKLLLEDNPYQRTPQWRGLYFTAAPGKGVFVEHLFTRFLPADQPLARRTSQPGLKRWLGSAASVVLVAMLTVLVLRLALTAMTDNQRLREAVASTCEHLTLTDNRLQALSDCARDLASVEDMERQAGLTWGLSHYRAALADKKRLLIAEFKKILDAYDARVEEEIGRRAVSFDHIVSSAQRLALVKRCGGGPSECRRRQEEPNLIFDPPSRVYLAVEPFTSRRKDARQTDADGLFELYLAYLRWGHEVDEESLATEGSKVSDYLRESISARWPSVEDVVNWGRARYESIVGDSFWDAPDVGASSRRAALPKVEAAFTAGFWQRVLEPTLMQVSLHTDASAQATEFRRRYFEQYLLSWHDFLAGFGKGIHYINKTTAPGFLDRASRGESPYSKLWGAVRENLFKLPLNVDRSTRWTLLWGEIRQDWTSAPGLIWGFLFNSEKKNGIAPRPWLIALNYTLNTDRRTVEKELPAFWARLQADKSGEAALSLAKDVFASNGEQPAQFAALKTIVEAPPKRFEDKMTSDDLVAWQSVAGEVQMLLALIGYQAGVRVDEDWKGRYYTEIRKDSEVSPAKALQVGMERFSRGTLAGFVNEADRKPKQVLGIALPLSRRFQGMLSEQGKTLSSAGDGKPMRIGTIELIQPSTFGMVKEGAKGTVIDVDCGGNVLSVSSKGESRVDRQVSIVGVPETCAKIRIKIALPEYELDEGTKRVSQDRLAAPQSLTRSYSGDVFAAFAEDFKTGAKTFTLSDFKASYAADEWDALQNRLRMMGINQVRVFAAVSLSPDLEHRASAAPSVENLPLSVIE